MSARSPASLAPLVVCCLVALATTGCRFNVAMLRALIGDTPVPSAFENQIGVSLSESQKRLLILCSASHSITTEEASLPLDIVSGVSSRLRPRGIEIVDADDVSNWLDDHGSWDDLGALGSEFNADYVAVIHLQGLSYKEPQSTNLFRAYATGELRVYEIVESDGQPHAAERFSSAINETYPTRYPIAADKTSESMFRKQALDHLCDLFARHFHDYRQSETI